MTPFYQGWDTYQAVLIQAMAPLSEEQGEQTYRYTRQRIIWGILKHDLHHGGELFLTLGTHGLPTPDV